MRVWGVVVSGGVVFGVGGRVRWVGWPWGGSAGVLVASVCRMVGVAHSCAFGVGGSSGIVRNSKVSSGRGPVPMCVDPLGAHGSKTAARDDRWKIPLFQQEPASPYRGPSLPCATSKTTDARQVHPPRPALRSVRFRFEIGPAQPGRPDVEARTTSSRAKAACRTSEPSTHSRPAEPDRSRHGLRPISGRKWTDLDASFDRSRRGLRPISAKGEARRAEEKRDATGVHRSVDTAVARPVVAGIVPRS